MKLFLATVLLLILGFVVYAAYNWENEEKLDLQQIQEIVKPKIADIKQFVGTLKQKLNKSEDETEQTAADNDDLTEPDTARFPIPDEQDFSIFEDEKQIEVLEKPLPDLDESDKPIKDVVERLLSSNYFGSMIKLEAVILRFVVTVDNLTKKKLATKYRLINPMAGKFLTSVSAGSINTADEKYIIDKNNYKRYTVFIKQFEDIESDKLVAVYIYYYPLIQEAYDSLGYSGRYFNDRFVEVIDHLLETPGLLDPVALERSTVTYKYANADLEARSAGQKILMRMGRENARKARKKLTQLRAKLTKFEPGNSYE